MRNARFLSGFSLALALLLVPVSAQATAADLVLVSETIRFLLLPLWVPAGVLVLTIAGITLVVSQDEGALEKARKAIIAVIAGGGIILLAPPLIAALYQTGGMTVNVATASVFEFESIGLSEWISTLAGIIGIFMIILAVLKAVGSFGDESSYTNARMSVLHVIIGLLIITANIIIRNVFFFGTPNPLIIFVIAKLQFVMVIISTLAMVIIIYAGIRMVLNFGNEEYFNSAKSLIYRAIIGLFVVGFSYAMVTFVASFFI